METRAYLKGTRLSPQKAALVADQIRGKKVDEALDFLIFNKQKGSTIMKKLLESAIANAENNNQFDIFPSKKDLKLFKSYKVKNNFCLFTLNVPWSYHAVSKYNGKNDRKFFYSVYDFPTTSTGKKLKNRKVIKN